MQINVRENIRRNPEWTVQRHWQHWARTTQDEDEKKQLCKTKTTNVPINVTKNQKQNQNTPSEQF
jgi:hypothetical protein